VNCKDDYLLFIAGVQKRSNEVFVYVYSLKAKVWRKIVVVDESELSVFSGGRGVLVNDTLHWDRTQVWISNKKCFCGFNLVDETFKDVRIPTAFLVNDGNLDFKLCEISGCLGAWSVNVNEVVDMWVLKQYGEWNSWVKLFKIDMVPGLRNFCGWTENGNALVQTDDGSLLLANTSKSPTVYKSIVHELGDIDAMSFIRSPISPLF